MVIELENSKYVVNNNLTYVTYDMSKLQKEAVTRLVNVQNKIFFEEWLNFNVIKCKFVSLFDINGSKQKIETYGVANLEAVRNKMILKCKLTGNYLQKYNDLFVNIEAEYQVFQNITIEVNKFNNNLRVVNLEENGVSNYIKIDGKTVENAQVPYTSFSKNFVVKRV